MPSTMPQKMKFLALVCFTLISNDLISTIHSENPDSIGEKSNENWKGWPTENIVSEVTALYDHNNNLVLYKDMSVPACFVEDNRDKGTLTSFPISSSFLKILPVSNLTVVAKNETKSKFLDEFCGTLPVFKISTSESGGHGRRVHRNRRRIKRDERNVLNLQHASSRTRNFVMTGSEGQVLTTMHSGGFYPGQTATTIDGVRRNCTRDGTTQMTRTANGWVQTQKICPEARSLDMHYSQTNGNPSRGEWSNYQTSGHGYGQTSTNGNNMHTAHSQGQPLAGSSSWSSSNQYRQTSRVIPAHMRRSYSRSRSNSEGLQFAVGSEQSTGHGYSDTETETFGGLRPEDTSQEYLTEGRGQRFRTETHQSGSTSTHNGRGTSQPQDLQGFQRVNVQNRNSQQISSNHQSRQQSGYQNGHQTSEIDASQQNGGNRQTQHWESRRTTYGAQEVQGNDVLAQNGQASDNSKAVHHIRLSGQAQPPTVVRPGLPELPNSTGQQFGIPQLPNLNSVQLGQDGHYSYSSHTQRSYRQGADGQWVLVGQSGDSQQPGPELPNLDKFQLGQDGHYRYSSHSERTYKLGPNGQWILVGQTGDSQQSGPNGLETDSLSLQRESDSSRRHEQQSRSEEAWPIPSGQSGQSYRGRQIDHGSLRAEDVPTRSSIDVETQSSFGRTEQRQTGTSQQSAGNVQSGHQNGRTTGSGQTNYWRTESSYRTTGQNGQTQQSRQTEQSGLQEQTDERNNVERNRQSNNREQDGRSQQIHHIEQEHPLVEPREIRLSEERLRQTVQSQRTEQTVNEFPTLPHVQIEEPRTQSWVQTDRTQIPGHNVHIMNTQISPTVQTSYRQSYERHSSSDSQSGDYSTNGQARQNGRRGQTSETSHSSQNGRSSQTAQNTLANSEPTGGNGYNRHFVTEQEYRYAQNGQHQSAADHYAAQGSRQDTQTNLRSTELRTRGEETQQENPSTTQTGSNQNVQTQRVPYQQQRRYYYPNQQQQQRDRTSATRTQAQGSNPQSQCRLVTFTCTMVNNSNGRAKLCRPTYGSGTGSGTGTLTTRSLDQGDSTALSSQGQGTGEQKVCCLCCC